MRLEINQPMRKGALALLLTGLLSGPAAAENIPGFTITPLKDFGFNDSEVRDINNHGFSVGDSISGTAFDAEQQAVFWYPDGNGAILDFDNYPRVDYQTARAINDAGLMVGQTDNKGSVVWIDQVSTRLPNAGGVFDINNANQIVGNASGLYYKQRAAIWNDLQVSLLGGEPADFLSSASAINDTGRVVGYMAETTSAYIPISWQNNQIEQLGYLPAFDSSAHGVSINNHDQMVGVSRSATNSRAVIWQNGQIADLGTLGGANANAIKINNIGQIIGMADTASGQRRPFLWQDGVMYDLAPAVCADVTNCPVTVSAINDVGQVTYNVKEGYFNQLAYVLNIANGALANLPSISAPLNFVTPVGAVPPVAVTPIPEEADVRIYMDASRQAIFEGEEIKYYLSVSNTGPTPAKDIVIIDTLPKNAELILEKSYLPEGCSVASLEVTCRFDKLFVGHRIYVHLNVKHIPPTRGKKKEVVKNSATVESSTRDPDSTNNKAGYITDVFK